MSRPTSLPRCKMGFPGRRRSRICRRPLTLHQCQMPLFGLRWAHISAPKKDDRIAAFTLYDGVKLYGGFAGNESALDQRPASGARTILSAKAAKDRYRFPHVLYGANNTLLDGLTIRDGRAVGLTYNGKG